MKRLAILQRISFFASATCLSVPYLLAGNWLIILLCLAMGVFGIFIKKRSAFWSASVLLLIFVFLAAIGMLTKFSAPLMIVACVAALAYWDLTNFEESLVSDQPPETRLLLERAHLQSLSLASSGGLILAIASSYLSLKIPFIGMILLLLLTLGCLAYSLRSLAKNSS